MSELRCVIVFRLRMGVEKNEEEEEEEEEEEGEEEEKSGREYEGEDEVIDDSSLAKRER